MSDQNCWCWKSWGIFRTFLHILFRDALNYCHTLSKERARLHENSLVLHREHLGWIYKFLKFRFYFAMICIFFQNLWMSRSSLKMIWSVGIFFSLMVNPFLNICCYSSIFTEFLTNFFVRIFSLGPIVRETCHLERKDAYHKTPN